MKLEVRYANHPEDSKHYTTDELRKHYLIEKLFLEDEINLVYSHVDRIIAGGIMPMNLELALDTGKELGVSYFFERREAGIINIGGEGKIIVDGTTYDMSTNDGLYIGKGSKDVKFSSVDKNNPPKFYFNSSPAHSEFPTRIITLDQARKLE
jgi:4-deoxy-L-threo-5-hexosulose-uronate ketol-isomerase